MIRFVFLSLLLISSVALAQAPDHETERRSQLNQARDFSEAMELMTPEELAREMGVKEDQQYGDAPLGIEDLLQYTAGEDYEVYINVSIAQQRLSIEYPGGGWTTLISSGRKGYGTKRGCYRPYYLAQMHYSKKYDNSPMPHSLFYYGGFAIHGTQYERQLGRPASHGCVRVSRADARQMFQIVKYYGAKNTLICVR